MKHATKSRVKNLLKINLAYPFENKYVNVNAAIKIEFSFYQKILFSSLDNSFELPFFSKMVLKIPVQVLEM